MANYKMTALLATALVSMAPLASAERDSRFTVVNLARADDTTMSVKTRSSSSFDADTFQGGVYKVGYDACQAQVKSATTPVSITLSGDKQTLTAENVPSSCMTITGALTNNYAEGYPIPLGSDKLEITNVTADTISRVQSALGASESSAADPGSATAAITNASAAASEGNMTSSSTAALNSTMSSRRRSPSRFMMRKAVREDRDLRLYGRD